MTLDSTVRNLFHYFCVRKGKLKGHYPMYRRRNLNSAHSTQFRLTIKIPVWWDIFCLKSCKSFSLYYKNNTHMAYLASYEDTFLTPYTQPQDLLRSIYFPKTSKGVIHKPWWCEQKPVHVIHSWNKGPIFDGILYK